MTVQPFVFLLILLVEVYLNLVLNIAEKGPDKDIFNHVFLLLEHSLSQGVCQRMIQVE